VLRRITIAFVSSRVRTLAPYTSQVLCLALDSGTRPADLPFALHSPGICYPTRSREKEWSNPNALSSHTITQMTTTEFKIDLMQLAIGMNRLISHRMTPTTIKVNKT